MAGDVFNIEFKFPSDQAVEWSTFAAKVRQSTAGVWEIYAVQSYSEAAVPFETKLLFKDESEWKEPETNRETLLAAIVGRAIDKATNRLR